VNPEHVARFYTILREGTRTRARRANRSGPVTESTAQSYMMTLRSFFRWCVEVERTRLDNPVAKVKLAKHDAKGRTAFCSKKQKNELIANAPDDDLRFILYCGFDAGLRRGEIDQVESTGSTSAGAERAECSTSERPTLSGRKIARNDRFPSPGRSRKFLKSYLKGKEPNDFALHPDVGKAPGATATISAGRSTNTWRSRAASG
jgi:hypothetical protein